MSLYPELRVYTVGRGICPFRFNPLIPPSGCEPHIWIKLIVDVMASAYLGGEGVISLLVAGLDHLYRQAGVFDKQQSHWPTIQDLLIWLKTVKLKGRAAMWQASAERILLGMTYGEFGAVLNTHIELFGIVLQVVPQVVTIRFKGSGGNVMLKGECIGPCVLGTESDVRENGR